MSQKSTVPVVITKHYDLLLWLMKQVPKFPRSHKFVLGDRIQNHALDVLECLLEAALVDIHVLRQTANSPLFAKEGSGEI